jgi:hypothetical protein
MRRVAVWSVLAAALLLLSACGDDKPNSQGDPPVLTGFDAMPKQIVTLALTATPTQVVVGAQAVSVSQPTLTAGPPPPTPTLTPYVGVFLGDTTSEDGEPVPTLEPYVINLNSSGVVVGTGGTGVVTSGTCGVPAASRFANAYNTNTTVQQRLGCPTNGGITVSGMVTEPFERGSMFWRGDTRLIYVLSTSGQFWQMADSWTESIPASDPAYSPPGGLIQPVRGFGLVWRSNQPIRDALGWATLSEAQYDGFWQDFERGAMFVGNNGLIYAVYTAEGQNSGPLSP